MFKAFFFDLDGTLCESGPGIMAAVRYALVKRGYPVPEAQLEAFIGPPLTDSFAKYCGMDKEEALRAVADYREYYVEKGVYESRPYDGITDTLEQLRAYGIFLAVASSKPEPMVLQMMEHFDLIRYFDCICGASLDESKAKKKQVIAHALKRCHLYDRQQVVMIGDRAEDMQGAKKNGLTACGVLYGYGTKEELLKAGADYIIKTPSDLIRLV